METQPIRLKFSPLNLLGGESQICKQDLISNFLEASFVPLYVHLHCHSAHVIKTVVVKSPVPTTDGAGLTVIEVIINQL
jgi:hypothetical protein